MTRSSRLPKASCLVLLAVAVGCAGDPARRTNGPLGASASVSDGVLCLPDGGDLAFVHSGEVLSNNSSAAVTLQSLDLVEPVNVNVISSLVAPTWIEGSSSMTLSFQALRINYKSAGDEFSFRTQTQVVVQDDACA